MGKAVYTVKEVAEILSIGLNKAYDLIHQDIIPYIRLGRKIRIPRKAFDSWLDQGCLLEENK